MSLVYWKKLRDTEDGYQKRNAKGTKDSYNPYVSQESTDSSVGYNGGKNSKDRYNHVQRLCYLAAKDERIRAFLTFISANGEKIFDANMDKLFGAFDEVAQKQEEAMERRSVAMKKAEQLGIKVQLSSSILKGDTHMTSCMAIPEEVADEVHAVYKPLSDKYGYCKINHVRIEGKDYAGVPTTIYIPAANPFRAGFEKYTAIYDSYLNGTSPEDAEIKSLETEIELLKAKLKYRVFFRNNLKEEIEIKKAELAQVKDKRRQEFERVKEQLAKTEKEMVEYSQLSDEQKRLFFFRLGLKARGWTKDYTDEQLVAIMECIKADIEVQDLGERLYERAKTANDFLEINGEGVLVRVINEIFEKGLLPKEDLEYVAKFLGSAYDTPYGNYDVPSFPEEDMPTLNEGESLNDEQMEACVALGAFAKLVLSGKTKTVKFPKKR